MHLRALPGNAQADHQPVMVEEVVRLLNVRPGGVYIDATVGSGGHARAIMAVAGASGFLLGIDLNAEALQRAQTRLAAFGDRVRLVRGNFADMAELAAREGIESVDGVVMDLGVSWEQLRSAERGFSFMSDGPLDMRMDLSGSLTASMLVNSMAEKDLAFLLRTVGERNARRIAGAIVEARRAASISTAKALSDVVVGAARGAGRRRLHPATKTFLALRIAVNDELTSLRAGLPAACRVLRPGGRLAVLSFHSLEDRIVKEFFADHRLVADGARQGPEGFALRVITKKPVAPSRDEVASNPRARSARLRLAERVQAVM